MSSTDTELPTTPSSPLDEAVRLDLSGPAPLLEGEDVAAYDELLVRISGTVKPTDILEEIWVRDIVDLVWEAFRLRRLKVKLISASAHKGLERILQPLVNWQDDVGGFGYGWSYGRDPVFQVG